MNPKSDEEKAQKKSVSMPPSDWAFVYAYAGDTGNASKVIQKAVRLLKQAGSSLEESGNGKIKKAIGKKAGSANKGE